MFVGYPSRVGLADDDGLVVCDGDGDVAVTDEDYADVERRIDGLEKGISVGGFGLGCDWKWRCDSESWFE